MMDQSQMHLNTLTSALGGSEVVLIIYSPAMIPEQIVRPYTYNFSSNLVGHVVNRDVHHIMTPASAKNASPDILQAILPDANGVRLNTAPVNDRWSFVLVVNHDRVGQQYRAGCGTRLITMGYFLDEPIAPNTLNNTVPVLNPNAMLVFTHTTGMNNTMTMGINGVQMMPRTVMDVEHVDVTTQQLFSQDMYLNTPGDVESSMMRNGNEMMLLPGQHALGAMTGKTARISTRLKSPIHQLQEIFHTYNQAISHSEQMDSAGIAGPMTFQSPDEILRGAIHGNLPGSASSGTNMSYILDTSAPMFFGALCSKFPNIQIMPFRIPMTPQYDVYPQDIVSGRNTMSAMVSSAVTFVAQQLWISDISFRYTSDAGRVNANMHGGSFIHGFQQSYYEVYTCVKVAQSSDEDLKRTKELFIQTLEWQLFPILKAFRGDFDLMCSMDVWGDTRVQLIFYDDDDRTPGMYTTVNRLGGAVSPTIGTHATIAHNAQQLAGLTTEAINHAYGSQARFS